MTHRIDPRIRALGKARIDVTRRAQNERDWQRMWKLPRYPLPFEFSGWKYSIQYIVDDYAAEIGFYIDVLGFPVNAFSPSYAQFTTPDQDFYFSVLSSTEDAPATPPEAIRLQFMVDDIEQLIEVLSQRGVTVERVLAPQVPAALLQAVLRSPHGICIELWAVTAETIDTEDGEDEELVVPSANFALHAPQAVEKAQESEAEVDQLDEFFQTEWSGALEESGSEGTNNSQAEDGQPDEPVYEDIYDTAGDDQPVQYQPSLIPSRQAQPGLAQGRSPAPQSPEPRTPGAMQTHAQVISGPLLPGQARRSNGAIPFPTTTREEP